MTSPNRDGFGGLVTLRICKLRECAKHVDPFICDCGCEFFRRHLQVLDLVRCNKCKVRHKLDLHSLHLEEMLEDMDRRFQSRSLRLERPVLTVSDMLCFNTMVDNSRETHQVMKDLLFSERYGSSSRNIQPTQEAFSFNSIALVEKPVQSCAVLKPRSNPQVINSHLSEGVHPVKKEWTRSLFP